LQHIVVAGDGNAVEFQTGSSVNLIAGNTIQLLPGTTIQEGANVHAYITTDGLYCDIVQPSIAITDLVNLKKADISNQTKGDEKPIGQQCITVFPNPNNGKFTIKIDGAEKATHIVIYNLLGAIVHQDIINSEKTIEIANVQRGIYFLKTLNTNELLFQKILIR